MIKKVVDKKEHFYYQVPKSFVVNDYREADNSVSNNLLLVYCAIDKWKNTKNQYRGTLLGLVKDCGIPLASDRNLSHMVKKIIITMEFMEDNKMFSVIEGDYRNVTEMFVLQVNILNFTNKKSYVLLDDIYLDYILNLKCSIKKSNLLQILLYVLSPKIEHKIVNKETGEIIKVYFQVFSESTHHIAKKLGISDGTIKKALSFLSDVKSENGKPLIVRQHKGYVKNGKYHKFPNIYTENSLGWEKRIMAEFKYYDKQVEKRLD